jgi:hypothetical protein
MTEGGVNISNIQGSSIHAHNIVGRDLVIQNFINGLNQVPLDYGTNIQNFLYEYLGSLDQRVPFGGREHDLTSLTTWLDSREAPRALLLTAEAGRGKSALLVRWSIQLQQRDDLAVIFVPVSIRFETAAQEVFFAALAARLAHVYGQPLKYQPMGGEQWKALCHEYLKSNLPDGKRVVLILDGLDEAAGWQAGASFMPMPLPVGVQVVASARVQAGKSAVAWLRQLGWHLPGRARSVTLAPLTRAGVENVLLQMGNPLDVLVTQVDIIGELFRLTEGDPLLVRLYIDELIAPDLQARSLTVEQLSSIQPGLAGYFEQWWEDQQSLWDVEKRNPLNESQVRAFFNVVASAFGPLSREDIITLTQEEGLDGVQIKTIATKVGRLIIGDGNTQGFAFSHPRLGYYFFDLLGKAAQGIWNERFIKMGRTFLVGLQEAKRTAWEREEIHEHGYIVQHYTTHLGRSGAIHERYYELICHEWAQAWEALRGTYDGFLGDVKRVWKQARHDMDAVRGIKMQLWCALCQSSIVTLSSNIDPNLLVGAIKAGAVSKTQGLVFLSQNHSEEGVAKAIALLAPYYYNEVEFLLPLLQVGCRAVAEGSRAEVLVTLAPHLPQEVLAVAWAVRDERYRAEVLVTLAPHLPQEEQGPVYQQALEAARAIRSEGYRAKVLGTLAPHLPQEEQGRVYQQALEAARAIENEWSRAKVLGTLAPHLPQEEQGPVYQQALEAARAITDERYRAKVLGTFAPYLPHEEQGRVYQQALEAARAIRSEEDRAEV